MPFDAVTNFLLELPLNADAIALLQGLGWMLGLAGAILYIQHMLKLSQSTEFDASFFREQKVYLDFGAIKIDLNSILSGVGLSLFVFLLTQQVAFSVIALLAGATFPSLVSMYLEDQRRKRFERDLPRTIDQIARRRRSGVSLREAVVQTADDAPAGTRSEMLRIKQELELETPLDVALDNASARIRSGNFSSFVVSFKVALERGGDIVSTLTKLSAALREMIRLQEKIKAATTEGKMSVYIIAVIPFFVIGVVMSMQPELLNSLTTSVVGLFMIVIAVVLYGLGFYLLQNILRTKI